MDKIISSATKRNWDKLLPDVSKKLTKRANKRMSNARFVPMEYVNLPSNIVFVELILKLIDENNWRIEDVLYSLGCNLLNKKDIYYNSHVKDVLSYYNYNLIQDLFVMDIPDEFDILGLIYQSFMTEGEKNNKGSYYTPNLICKNMVSDFYFNNDEIFLDPCCGSGAFLLALECDNPMQLFGVDSDSIAVFICKLNLLLKFDKHDFIPQVFCCDYLCNDLLNINPVKDLEFDYIATNPPWGSKTKSASTYLNTTYNDSFSDFFTQAFQQLKSNGTMRFLFPESVLNVKSHQDIRCFMLEKCNIKKIVFYNSMFTGVTTKYIDITVDKSKQNSFIDIVTSEGTKSISCEIFGNNQNNIFNVIDNIDFEIITTIKNRGKYTLSESEWALGIVTGDNKAKLFDEKIPYSEKIYTGKEISKYVLKPAKKYLIYDRTQLQQVARDSFYRAPEKLVYKFISNKLVFAYDDSQSLFLNSANILIPKVKNMSIKTVMAFLNSELFQYYYMQIFGEIKILKGNLLQIPFPEIDESTNIRVEKIVDSILQGETQLEEILQKEIYSIYNLSDEHISNVRSKLYGAFN